MFMQNTPPPPSAKSEKSSPRVGHRLTYGGADYVDDVRIVRCQAPSGGDNWFRLGAQFLWTTHPSERSLRRVIAGVQPAALQAMRFEGGRQS